MSRDEWGTSTPAGYIPLPTTLTALTDDVQDAKMPASPVSSSSTAAQLQRWDDEFLLGAFPLDLSIFPDGAVEQWCVGG